MMIKTQMNDGSYMMLDERIGVLNGGDFYTIVDGEMIRGKLSTIESVLGIQKKSKTMMYKFKSEEAMNKFVSDTPYTDRHNLIFASLVGLDPFKMMDSIPDSYAGLNGYWVAKGGQEFFITEYEKEFFEKVC